MEVVASVALQKGEIVRSIWIMVYLCFVIASRVVLVIYCLFLVLLFGLHLFAIVSFFFIFTLYLHVFYSVPLFRYTVVLLFVHLLL